jgi:hypothetical protein
MQDYFAIIISMAGKYIFCQQTAIDVNLPEPDSPCCFPSG